MREFACPECSRSFPTEAGRNVHAGMVHGLLLARHGTVSRYVSHNCRCATCKSAWAAKGRERALLRIERPIPDSVVHGRASTYGNYGCRCDACRKAKSIVNAKRRKRKEA